MASSCLSAVAFWPPEHVCQPYSWVGHIPFAFWAVEALRPDRLVELGAHTGNSYFAFCQAVMRLGLPTRCHAVDTWQGDEHAGFYGDEVYQSVSERNRSEYDSFSSLIRARFDEAHGQFDEGSIDLLHIDGLHTYEAVKHDFEMWLPKMSTRGIVLLHDTNVHDRDFGVHRLFREESSRYPAFEFLHSHGLGILAVGAETPEAFRPLLRSSADDLKVDEIRASYERLGQAVLDHAARADSAAIAAARSSELALVRDVLVATQRHIKAIDEHRSVLEASRSHWEQETARLQEAFTAEQQGRLLLQSRIEVLQVENQRLEARKQKSEAESQQANAEISRLNGIISTQDGAIHEIHQSLGWMLLDRGRRVRETLVRDHPVTARYWAAMTRRFRSTAS